MDLLLMVLTLLLIVVLAFIEYKVARVIYTPFILFACPYGVIMFVQYYSTKIYNLTDISLEYVFTLCEHFIIVWLIDMLALKFFYNRRGRNRLEAAERRQVIIKGRWKVLEILGVVSAMYLLLSFLLNMRGLATIGQIVQVDFQNRYADGLNFYLRLICMIATVYFFSFVSMDKKRYFVFGMLCLMPNVLTFVKGTILICVVGGFIGNIIVYERTIKLKYLLIAAASAVLIFFGVYLVEICIWEPEKFFDVETYQYIFAKFNCYLMAGLQGFNERLSDSIVEFSYVDNVVYSPIANAFAKLGITERIDAVCDIRTTLGDIPYYGILDTNVYSHVGILVLYCGHIGACLIEGVVAALQIIFFIKMRNTRKTAYYILYSLFVSVYVLAWFNYYLSHTFWMYLLILVAVFAICSKCRFVKIKVAKIGLRIKIRSKG